VPRSFSSCIYRVYRQYCNIAYLCIFQVSSFKRCYLCDVQYPWLQTYMMRIFIIYPLTHTHTSSCQCVQFQSISPMGFRFATQFKGFKRRCSSWTHYFRLPYTLRAASSMLSYFRYVKRSFSSIFAELREKHLQASAGGIQLWHLVISSRKWWRRVPSTWLVGLSPPFQKSWHQEGKSPKSKCLPEACFKTRKEM